jgi:FtsZ-interacting cell division protein YlmF
MQLYFSIGAVMRKALTYGVFFIACGAGIGTVDGAYVIKLKNGNEYVTTRYWREGKEVLFETYDGVFGIENSFVAKIEKTEQVVRLITAFDREPTDKPQADSMKPIDEPDSEKVKEPKKEKAPDDPIVGEFNRLKETSKEVDGMLTSEIRELLNQVTAFKNKLTKDSKLFIDYGREFNDLNEIGDIVETALRSRTQ